MQLNHHFSAAATHALWAIMPLNFTKAATFSLTAIPPCQRTDIARLALYYPVSAHLACSYG